GRRRTAGRLNSRRPLAVGSVNPSPTSREIAVASTLEQMRRRQQVLAEFGDLSLRSEALDEVLSEACRLVADALGTGHAKILQIVDDGETLAVRAGVGWGADVVGKVRLPMDELNSETYAIRA